MPAAPIAKPEGKASSTAFLMGRSFMMGVSLKLLVLSVHATESYSQKKEATAPDAVASVMKKSRD
jgi:hypothetical protein